MFVRITVFSPPWSVKQAILFGSIKISGGHF